MSPKTKPLVQNWILLIHQLPPRPTNLRVRIWRKLHIELERIAANDFFEAAGRAGAFSAFERCQKAIRAAQGPTGKAVRSQAKHGNLDVAKYQGQRWVTRRNLHIDRLASAWLIKQFIDKRPRFYFVADGETVEGAIPFDMFGSEFTHH